eukprot:gene350-15254_t
MLRTIPVLVLALFAKSDSVCVDHTADGYYVAESGSFIQGFPGGGIVPRPASISPCELAQLSQDCVERINSYRTGKLGFSNGIANLDLPLSLEPLREQTSGHQCSSRQAMGDLFENVNRGGGACSGAHTAFQKCPHKGLQLVGQNTCCGRGGSVEGPTFMTYGNVKDELFDCLQSMWDEGIDGKSDENGNFMRMKNENFKYASCGFAWTDSGRIMMNQDFTDGVPEEFAGSECNCEGKSVGDQDGCPQDFGSRFCVGNGTSWVVLKDGREDQENVVPIVGEVSASATNLEGGAKKYFTKESVVYFITGVLGSLAVMLPIAAFLLRRTGRKFSHPW